MKNTLVFAAAFFAAAAPAQAEDATTATASPIVAYVPYQPSDLDTAQAVRDLQGRVRRTARQLCQPSEDTFMGSFKEQNCLSPTLRDAFAQVDRAAARRRSGAQASADHITVRAR